MAANGEFYVLYVFKRACQIFSETFFSFKETDSQKGSSFDNDDHHDNLDQFGKCTTVELDLSDLSNR